MNRRRLLKLAGLAGLGLVAPISLRDGHADPGKYEGACFLVVDVDGGWDTTLLCDPRGGDIDHVYAASEIEHAGNLAYAPLQGFYAARDFFQRWHSRLLVINGIDTQTNNHDIGKRTTWSGQLAEGYPSFAALAASVALDAQNVPLAFLSNGGYEATEGVCPLSRVGSPGAAKRLAYPNTIHPDDPASASYTTPTTASRIAAAQAARLAASMDRQELPSMRAAMSKLFVARAGDPGLSALAKELASTPLVTLADFPDLAAEPNLTDLERFMQQAQIAAIALNAGVAVSANLQLRGFDTHYDHDANHPTLLLKLMRGLDYVFELLDAMDLSERTYVVVGSDFGRSPAYNAFEGKDHWSITSMMMTGPTISGDRVVGATDAALVGVNLDASLQPSASGTRISTSEIHRALRKLARVTGTRHDTEFPLPGRDLPFPIFG